MSNARFFPRENTQAGVTHVIDRIVDRAFKLQATHKDVMVRMLKAVAAFHQVQILTFCVMSNHVHLLVRVPERPEGFSLTLEEVLGLLERGLSRSSMKLIRSQLELWSGMGETGESAIEEWRQRQLARMFSLSRFMQTFKQQFTQWFNRQSGRTGTLWERRFTSVVVEDAERALRTMATYIDLNPLRAGMVEDPGSYRWCGYAEAMGGNAAALAGLARVVGVTADGENSSEDRFQSSERATGGSGEEPGKDAAGEVVPTRKAGLRILVAYRQLLGLTGRARTRDDGTVVRRGVNAKLREKWDSERGVRPAVLLRRVQHLTRGVIFGSRTFIDEWFERNRDAVRGKSRTGRTSGARAIGKRADWRLLFSFRTLAEQKK